MSIIGPFKTLKLPKYRVPSPRIERFQDFDEFEWSGRCLSQDNLSRIPVYGNCGGIGGSQGTSSFYCTKTIPQTLLVIGDGPPLSLQDDHGDDLTKYRISLLQDGGGAELFPGTFYKLFPCTTSTMCNYQWYTGPPSGPLPDTFTPTLIDDEQEFGEILSGRYIGGKLLAFIQINLAYLTNGLDIANDIGVGGGFGLETIGPIISGHTLSSIAITTRSDVVSALSNLISVAEGDFEKIQLVVRLYWRTNDANLVQGSNYGTGCSLSYLETEAALVASTLAADYITVTNEGDIGTDPNPQLFSESEVWDAAVDFFGIS